ncbi:MAG: copper resistance protein NlpE N-terminal domain-containing protein [Moraxellaceae bacterium]
MRAVLCVALAALALAACKPAPKTEVTTTDAAVAPASTAMPPAGEPATGLFTGTLPCADCPGIETRVQLRPDGRFLLHEQFTGRRGAATASDFGRWEEAEGRVTLHGKGQPRTFLRAGADRLRPAEAADAAFGLARDTRSPGFLQPVSLHGAFTYLADGASLRDCLTGLVRPVAMSADYLALEREYLASRTAPGAALGVQVEVTLEMQPAMEGEGQTESWVVRRFVTALPGAACPAA